MIIEMLINDNILILYFHFNFDAKYEQYEKHYAQTHDIMFVEFNLAMKISYAINKFLNIFRFRRINRDHDNHRQYFFARRSRDQERHHHSNEALHSL
jgi:uncharacterized membrane protein affecting hemolysin expression